MVEVKINTPELYAQLKAGVFNAVNAKFIITSDVLVEQDELLDEVSLFADSPIALIDFDDEYGNSVELNTYTKTVKAVSESRISLWDLPIDYETYKVIYKNAKVLPVVEDADAMSNWKSAEDIAINLPMVGGSQAYPSEEFSDRLEQLQAAGEVIQEVNYFGPLICNFFGPKSKQ